MKKGFMIDPAKMAVCLATSLGFWLIAAAFLKISRPVPTLVLAAAGVIYLIGAAMNGAVVRWDREGVSRFVLGIKAGFFSWEEIEEVGVAGSKVFNKGNPDKTGRLYLYFSKKKMDEKDRFEMMLHWPPKDKIYLLYQADRIEYLRTVYSGKIETYNEGELVL